MRRPSRPPRFIKCFLAPANLPPIIVWRRRIAKAEIRSAVEEDYRARGPRPISYRFVNVFQEGTKTKYRQKYYIYVDKNGRVRFTPRSRLYKGPIPY